MTKQEKHLLASGYCINNGAKQKRDWYSCLLWHSPLFRSSVACALEKTCCREYDTSSHPVMIHSRNHVI